MDSERVHILLVEDSKTHATIICEALDSGPKPVKLTVARSLAEARTCLAEFKPDMALIDLLLPDGRGTELLLDDQEATYPVVVITSHGDEQVAVEAMKAGALDYVVKSAATLADMPRIVERTLREWNQISERKRAELALCESEERFRSFFESAASGMAIISPEYRPLKVNPTFCRLSGYSEAEALNKNIFEVTHPEDREETRRLYDEIRAGRRKVIDYEKRYIRKDGSIVWGRVTVAGVFGPNKELLNFAANIQDISERKQVVNLLRESQQMLQLVLDNIPQYVFWKDRNSVYLGCNQNFARAAGIGKPENIVGKTDYDLPWKKEESDFYRQCDKKTMETDTPEYHIIEGQLQADGKQAWVDTNKVPLHNSEGNVVGILGTYEDITERKQAEEKLKQTNREMEAFVYTVSHDLRTPLTPIIGYADFLRESCRDRLNEQELGCLAEISTSGERMVALMEDLLTLAKVGRVEWPAEPFDAGEVVNDVVCGLAEIIIQTGVTVSVGPLPTLRVPKTLLAQIFDNLIGNAVRYAGKEGSPINVGGERRGDLVRLYVRDHGPGIPEEERGRIFEVFYRGATGKKSPGTGVGLATVQKIARLYGGRAWVEETDGGGSTFWVEMVGIPTAAEDKEDNF